LQKSASESAPKRIRYVPAVGPRLRWVDDDGLDIEETQHIGCQATILLYHGGIHLVPCLEGDEGIDHWCFVKVLELEWGVA